TKLFYALRMPSFARERLKVLAKFTGIPEALAAAFDSDPKKLGAKFHRIEHHQAHLASAFFVSPFEHAFLLSADGLGDFASTMWGLGIGNRMEIDGAIPFPHSLGLYYTAVTQYLGFPKFGDEYKVMGLAAYGQPERLEVFRDILRHDHKFTGFHLGLKYFTHHRTGPEMTWVESDKMPALGKLFSEEMSRKLGPARSPEEPLDQRHRSLAASLQARLEEVYFRMLTLKRLRTPIKAVCLAGGVAFNCVANGKILDRTGFEQVYVHPAAGDAGLAVGAAFYVWHQKLGKPRSFVMDHTYWGPGYSREEIRRAIDTSGLARDCYIIAEPTAEYFEKPHPSPFMTLAYGVRPEKRDKIPAPTHVDGTCRLQTVTREANPRYHALISAYRDLTGVPVVLNTSFNDNEPIVCRPEEAVDCFLRTQMDALVLGDFLIS